MHLPLELLDQVEYYEKYVVEPFWSSGFRTKITLHFKQWWKPRKTFKFKWDFVCVKDWETTTWKPSMDAIRLEQQLLEYFSLKVSTK